MAKRFQYRLESILKIKTNNVELAKEELAKVIALKVKKLDDINTKNNEIGALNLPTLKPKLDELRTIHHRKSFLESEKVKLKTEIEGIEDIENLRKQKLQIAMQEEKVFLKLKEKEFEEFRKELLKEEAIFFDEIAINRFVRQENHL
jgi:flagellar export protein FliJ